MPLDELVQFCLVVSSRPAPLGTHLTLPDFGEQFYVWPSHNLGSQEQWITWCASDVLIISPRSRCHDGRNPVFSVFYVILNDKWRNYFTSGYFNFSSIINKNWFLSRMTEQFPSYKNPSYIRESLWFPIFTSSIIWVKLWQFLTVSQETYMWIWGGKVSFCAHDIRKINTHIEWMKILYVIQAMSRCEVQPSVGQNGF